MFLMDPFQYELFWVYALETNMGTTVMLQDLGFKSLKCKNGFHASHELL